VTTTIEDLPDVDHIFLGEAETTLPQFIEDLEKGTARRSYKAVGAAATFTTPVADFHLADLKRYKFDVCPILTRLPVQLRVLRTSSEIYGRVPRTKSNQQIIAELDALLQLGWRGTVFIVDDNFIGNKKNVRRLLPDLAAWQKRMDDPFSLLTEASVNLADDQ